jgi:hypothetical protein
VNDDDLPVLTQVLRTGSGRREASPSQIEAAEAFDVRPIEDTLMADQLTIGNEPHPGVDDYLVPSFDEGHVATDPAAGAPAIVMGRSEAFQRPQDDDETTKRHGGETFGEPDLQHPSVDGFHVDHFATSTAPRPDVPFDAAALTIRVRDAVLEDLQTRIDTEFDARVAQAIHRELETALAQLQVALRGHLTDALRDVVQRAVDEEVARLDPHRTADPAS